MSTRNLARHVADTPSDLRSAWFTGSTALKKGMGVCYAMSNSTYGKGMAVALPDNTNNQFFAGFVAHDYPAVAGGRMIEFSEPGGVVEVVPLSLCTARSTRLTCVAGGAAAGHFIDGGFAGRGTVVALEAVAAITSTDDEGFVASSTDGTATVAADGITITDTSAFGGAAAGDRVFILGGKTTADGSVAVTVGEYEIASVTSSSVIVLTEAVCSVASVIAYAIVRGNPTIKALALDGPESGLVEYISSIATGAATTAFTAMVGGETRFVGGETALGDGTGDDFTFTLADGEFYGQRKKFTLLDGIGSQGDILITVTTGSFAADHAQATSLLAFDDNAANNEAALASVELDASNDTIILEWTGNTGVANHKGGWIPILNRGCNLA